jgi:hypothetical protein
MGVDGSTGLASGEAVASSVGVLVGETETATVGVIVATVSEVVPGLTAGAGVGVPQATSTRTINRANRTYLYRISFSWQF